MTEIDRAWELVKKQSAKIEKLRTALLEIARAVRDDNADLDNVYGIAYRALNGVTCDRCGAEYTTVTALQMHQHTTGCGTEKDSG